MTLPLQVPARLRHLAVGATFRLKRTGDRYTLLSREHDTPAGTRYVVQRHGFARPTTLHPSCHVEPTV